MGKTKSIVTGLAYLGLLLPGSKASGQGFLKDIAQYVFGVPNWQVQAHGGVSDFGRFLLQSTLVVPPVGFLQPQRELRANSAFAFGGTVGGNILPRTGFRLGASFTDAELEYRDDTGNDTDVLDRDDLASLKNTMLNLEIMRYLLPERMRFNAYGTLGFVLTWWKLGSSAAPDFVGIDTEFRLGGMSTLGLQYKVADAWRIRLEAASATLGNPFTGNDSFRPTDGFTIDEPTRVRRTDFRLGLAYTFGKPERPSAPIPTAK
jgi:hypothetical protein